MSASQTTMCWATLRMLFALRTAFSSFLASASASASFSLSVLSAMGCSRRFATSCVLSFVLVTCGALLPATSMAQVVEEEDVLSAMEEKYKRYQYDSSTFIPSADIAKQLEQDSSGDEVEPSLNQYLGARINAPLHDPWMDEAYIEEQLEDNMQQPSALSVVSDALDDNRKQQLQLQQQIQDQHQGNGQGYGQEAGRNNSLSVDANHQEQGATAVVDQHTRSQHIDSHRVDAISRPNIMGGYPRQGSSQGLVYSTGGDREAMRMLYQSHLAASSDEDLANSVTQSVVFDEVDEFAQEQRIYDEMKPDEVRRSSGGFNFLEKFFTKVFNEQVAAAEPPSVESDIEEYEYSGQNPAIKKIWASKGSIRSSVTGDNISQARLSDDYTIASGRVAYIGDSSSANASSIRFNFDDQVIGFEEVDGLTLASIVDSREIRDFFYQNHSFLSFKGIEDTEIASASVRSSASSTSSTSSTAQGHPESHMLQGKIVVDRAVDEAMKLAAALGATNLDYGSGSNSGSEHGSNHDTDLSVDHESVHASVHGVGSGADIESGDVKASEAISKALAKNLVDASLENAASVAAHNAIGKSDAISIHKVKGTKTALRKGGAFVYEQQLASSKAKNKPLHESEKVAQEKLNQGFNISLDSALAKRDTLDKKIKGDISYRTSERFAHCPMGKQWKVAVLQFGRNYDYDDMFYQTIVGLIHKGLIDTSRLAVDGLAAHHSLVSKGVVAHLPHSDDNFLYGAANYPNELFQGSNNFSIAGAEIKQKPRAGSGAPQHEWGLSQSPLELNQVRAFERAKESEHQQEQALVEAHANAVEQAQELSERSAANNTMPMQMQMQVMPPPPPQESQLQHEPEPRAESGLAAASAYDREYGLYDIQDVASGNRDRRMSRAQQWAAEHMTTPPNIMPRASLDHDTTVILDHYNRVDLLSADTFNLWHADAAHGTSYNYYIPLKLNFVYQNNYAYYVELTNNSCFSLMGDGYYDAKWDLQEHMVQIDELARRARAGEVDMILVFGLHDIAIFNEKEFNVPVVVIGHDQDILYDNLSASCDQAMLKAELDSRLAPNIILSAEQMAIEKAASQAALDAINSVTTVVSQIIPQDVIVRSRAAQAQQNSQHDAINKIINMSGKGQISRPRSETDNAAHMDKNVVTADNNSNSGSNDSNDNNGNSDQPSGSAKITMRGTEAAIQLLKEKGTESIANKDGSNVKKVEHANTQTASTNTRTNGTSLCDMPDDKDLSATRMAISALDNSSDIESSSGAGAVNKASNNLHGVSALVATAGVDEPHRLKSMLTFDKDDMVAFRPEFTINEYSPYKNIHVHLNPLRYYNDIEFYHSMFGFKRLGVIVDSNHIFRLLHSVTEINEVTQRLGIDSVICEGELIGNNTMRTTSEFERCVTDLANAGVDAVYLTRNNGSSIHQLYSQLKPLTRRNIPVFTRSGSAEVKAGALMSIGYGYDQSFGRFEANVISQLMRGIPAERISQYFYPRTLFTVNAKTAIEVGWFPEYRDLLRIDVTYLDIASR